MIRRCVSLRKYLFWKNGADDSQHTVHTPERSFSFYSAYEGLEQADILVIPLPVISSDGQKIFLHFLSAQGKVLGGVFTFMFYVGTKMFFAITPSKDQLLPGGLKEGKESKFQKSPEVDFLAAEPVESIFLQIQKSCSLNSSFHLLFHLSL